MTLLSEHSALLERMVNEAYKFKPGIKIMFSSGPMDIIEWYHVRLHELSQRRS